MEIKSYVQSVESALVSDLCELIRIPSVMDLDSKDDLHPFGDNVEKGLEWILNKAHSMGMDALNVDHYAGEITVGNGPFMIGILVHEDVVAAGEGWNTDPFEPVIRDGKIYGRGSSDDKGPLISSLYAVKYLMDHDMIPEGTCIRMIIGTNEEELWDCIDHYVKVADRLPDYSIVPDGYFPMIFCEKGLLDFNLIYQSPADQNADILVTELSGGSGRNIVPGEAQASLICRNADPEKVTAILNQYEGIKANCEKSCIQVISIGKGTHAMSPENGRNAITHLIAALGTISASLSIQGFIERFNEHIGLDYNGGKTGFGYEDELSGKLTFNVGMIKMEEDRIFIEANIRYPASLEKESTIKSIQEKCEAAGFVYEFYDYLPPVYIEPNSPFMTRLMDVYREVSGDQKTEPYVIGGATYARSIPNAVAYGPLFPYEIELAHEPNEYLTLDSLRKMTEIYIRALYALLTIPH